MEKDFLPATSTNRNKLLEVTNRVVNIRDKFKKNLSASSLKNCREEAAAAIAKKSISLGNLIQSETRVAVSKLSMKFRSSTRRRQVLENAYTPVAAGKVKKSPARTKQLLGRTPTKLYSPFAIDTPNSTKEDNSYTNHVELTPAEPARRSPRVQNQKNWAQISNSRFYSPTGRMQNDVNAVRESLSNMQVTVNSVVRRSLRKQLNGQP